MVVKKVRNIKHKLKERLHVCSYNIYLNRLGRVMDLGKLFNRGIMLILLPKSQKYPEIDLNNAAIVDWFHYFNKTMVKDVNSIFLMKNWSCT